MNEIEISRYISLILRHKPETIGITLDKHGWADVRQLIDGVNRTHPLNMEILEEIVRTDNKQRYSFNEEKTKIRANQGHSIPVDVELKEEEPPEYLWHGTGEQYASSIDRQGLRSKARLYVHLSCDKETASAVGQRHGKPVVYKVHSGRMAQDGYKFYRSVNGVWLTKSVPIRYLEKEKQIQIEEVTKEKIAEFWKLHWEYLNRDIFPNVTIGPEAKEEEREYFRSGEYRNTMEAYMKREPDKAHMIYFYYKSKRIGCAEYVTYKSEDGKCLLMEFWIFPKFRGKGMGRECFGILRDYALRDGAIYFEINISNEKNRKFWSELGFKDSGTDEWGMPLMRLDQR